MEIMAYVFFALVGVIIFHHVLYPVMMIAVASLFSSRRKSRNRKETPPSIQVVIPACNEEQHIYNKLSSLSKSAATGGDLEVTVLDDGSTDRTAFEINRAIAEFSDLKISLVSYPHNAGKMKRLNEYLPTVEKDVIVLTDSSALLGRTALRRIAWHFAEDKVDVVAGGYGLSDETPIEQRIYWKIQTLIKKGESILGALVGAHGACYAIRSKHFQKLPDATINDDFVLPTSIVLKGGRAVYDPEIRVFEAEVDDTAQDLKRRQRIGAGNAQQLVYLAPMLLRHLLTTQALCCISGKMLRVFIGPILLIASALITYLGLLDGNWLLPAILWLLAYPAAFVGQRIPLKLIRLPSRVFMFFLYGHMMSLKGAMMFLIQGSKGWRRLEERNWKEPVASRVKRLCDLVVAVPALVILSPLFPVIALWIKLDSSGPVFFSQRRVGRVLPDRTMIFSMYKFRSMRTDAEASGKPVWASENDNRVTFVGRILRKTRLDELPQLINVIKGDMSLVGPRPERPGFYKALENAVPCFVERTYWLRPGITGLAQVEQGYTDTIEEARTKAMFDHAYAIQTHSLKSCLKTDLKIVVNTFKVMALGRGR